MKVWISFLMKIKKKLKEEEQEANEETDESESATNNNKASQSQVKPKWVLYQIRFYSVIKFCSWEFFQDAIGDFPALWTSNSSGE